MPHLRAWLPVLFAVLLSACAAVEPPTAASKIERWDQLEPSLGLDAIYLDVAVVVQPFDDAFLKHDLWLTIDEQRLSLKKKSLLEANGYRVGVLGGQPSSYLQELLTDSEFCPVARRIAMRMNHSRFLPIGPVLPFCSGRGHASDSPLVGRLGCSPSLRGGLLNDRDGVAAYDSPRALEVKDAQMGFMIAARPSDRDRVVLSIEPCVQHGRQMLLPTPVAGESEWMLRAAKPEQRYPQLGWELDLAAKEYAVIGGLQTAAESLGYHSFFATNDEVQERRLLVIRVTRVNSAGHVTHWAGPISTEARSSLAAQAASSGE